MGRLEIKMYIKDDNFSGREEICMESKDMILLDDEIARHVRVLNMDGEKRYQIKVLFNKNPYNFQRSIPDEIKQLGENIPDADSFDEAMDIVKGIFLKYIQREDVIREKDSEHRYDTNYSGRGTIYVDGGANYIDEIWILDKAGNDEYHVNVLNWVNTYVMLKAMGIIPKSKTVKKKKDVEKEA